LLEFINIYNAIYAGFYFVKKRQGKIKKRKKRFFTSMPLTK